MRVFVLGGTGSIGSPTVRVLIQRGHDVWALARSDESYTSILKLKTRDFHDGRRYLRRTLVMPGLVPGIHVL